MFAIKKLVLVAACVALALGPATVAAEPQSAHLRVRVHEHAHATKALQQASSGTGADVGATVGGSGKGDNDDDSDASDDSDVTDTAEPSGSAATASVVGGEDPAATTAPPADDAATEEPTVDIVIEVVSDPTEAPPPGDTPFCAADGEYQVSVEYAEGVYCVKGQACVGDHTDGVCPGPQLGLPFGSRCDKVSSGVYGCTMNREAAPATIKGNNDDDDDDSDASDDSDDKDAAAGSSGSAATAGTVGDEDPVAITAPPTDDAATEAPPSGDTPFCAADGEYQVSVEYAEGVYCVKGQACVGDHTDGVCPGPQLGLPFGSRCDKVSSGVYGCTMNREAASATSAPPSATAADDGAESSGSSDDSNDSLAAVDSADFCPGDDEYEMSVEGATGVFCIKGQACVADIADGVCPEPQKGLPFGSHCGAVQNNTYGCKVNSPPAKELHKKTQHASVKKKDAAHTTKHQSKTGKSKTKVGKSKTKTRGHGSSKKATATAAKKETSKTANHASTKSNAAASKTTKSKKIRSHGRNRHGKTNHQ